MNIFLPDGVDFGADPIAGILTRYRTIGVVGLSSNFARPSYGVSEYMQSVGYRIIPVNPNEREVLGEKSYSRLEDVSERVEIVDIFRRTEAVSAVVESGIRIAARVIWMQLGVEHQESAERARAAGMIVVMDACIMVEHKHRRQTLRP